MSHFLTLVIGPNPEDQLQPFHEFECTGTVDQYVQSIDVTEENLQGYQESTYDKVLGPDGALYNPYDSIFYRDPTSEEVEKLEKFGSIGGSQTRDWCDGKGRRTKINEIPVGFTKQTFKTSEQKTFSEYLESQGNKKLGPLEEPELHGKHQYGWFRVDENDNVIECINRTNPNAHWDWWVFGGRFSSFLKYKSDRSQFEYNECVPVSYIDFDRMKDIAEDRARSEYKKVVEAIGDPLPKLEDTWAELLKDQSKTYEEKRSLYNNQPIIKKFSDVLDFFYTYEDFSSCTEDEYAESARNNAVTPYAIVKDGVWYEMGWWGISSNEMSLEDWAKKVAELLSDLSPDEVISAVDCHI